MDDSLAADTSLSFTWVGLCKVSTKVSRGVVFWPGLVNPAGLSIRPFLRPALASPNAPAELNELTLDTWEVSLKQRL